MRDQAVKLRELARQPSRAAVAGLPGMARSPRVIALTSGKGGVGKTNLTINLALSLAQRGKRVLVMDADLGLANVTVALGLHAPYSVMDVLSGARSLAEVMLEGPEGIRIIPGGNGVAELADLGDAARERLLGAFQRAALDADFVLIDTAAGISKNVLSFALAADTVLVVTVPEPPAMADAYGIIKALYASNPGVDVRLVVNRVRRDYEAKAVHDKLGLVVKRFLSANLQCLGAIREDTAVSNAVREQKALVLCYPDSNAAAGVREICAKLLQGQDAGRGGLRGFLERLAGWFH
ncbi:MAG: MinD/ParA family protein [Candidatus Wallbacteria bacterium]|nr:MinD/ParA family protein [Candidatus Wallbacteria bacterium]